MSIHYVFGIFVEFSSYSRQINLSQKLQFFVFIALLILKYFGHQILDIKSIFVRGITTILDNIFVLPYCCFVIIIFIVLQCVYLFNLYNIFDVVNLCFNTTLGIKCLSFPIKVLKPICVSKNKLYFKNTGYIIHYQYGTNFNLA